MFPRVHEWEVPFTFGSRRSIIDDLFQLWRTRLHYRDRLNQQYHGIWWNRSRGKIGLDWRRDLRLRDGSDSELNAAFTWNSFIEFVGCSRVLSMPTRDTYGYTANFISALHGFVKRLAIAWIPTTFENLFCARQTKFHGWNKGETWKGCSLFNIRFARVV